MRPLNILFIDDEKDLGEIVTVLAKKQGLNVDVFSDPRDGLNACLKKSYDCVILDMNMPGMTGDDVIQKMRQNSNLTEVVICSGQEDMLDKKVLGECGAFKRIKKVELFSFLRDIEQYRPFLTKQVILSQEHLEFECLIKNAPIPRD